MKPRAIEIMIEQLTLDGFEHADRAPIAAAIERALTERFTESARPPDARAEIRLDVAAPVTPGRIGTSIAGALTRSAP